MCGIIGYTGHRDSAEVILSGLFSLEYRGYDSAGLAVFTDDGIKTVRSAGKVRKKSLHDDRKILLQYTVPERVKEASQRVSVQNF